MTVPSLRLPDGTNDLAVLRQRNELYIDKTVHIADMLDRVGKYCFMARPRRFGKSLLISTLEHLFQGHGNLFRGTALQARRPHSDNWAWPQPVPVIRLNMNGLDITNDVAVKAGLCRILLEIFDDFALSCPPCSDDHIGLFHRLLTDVATHKGRVTVLVDEYDYALLHNLDNPALPAIQDVLASFYGVLKNHDVHLRFVFITGLTRFAHMSLFSGLNNLRDLSHDDRCHSLFGFTQAEVDDNLLPFMTNIRDSRRQPVSDTRAQLRMHYHGYCFVPGLPDTEWVYNPYTLISCLAQQILQSYWTATGIPSFLPKVLLAQRLNVADIRHIQAEEIMESAFEVEELRMLGSAQTRTASVLPVSTLARLMFQIGYLTLVPDRTAGEYVTDFPNQEVATSFIRHLFRLMAHPRRFDFRHTLDICRAVLAHDPATMKVACNQLFAQLSHYGFEPHAAHYQALIHTALMPIRHLTHLGSEIALQQDRSDLIVDMPDAIVIMELQMDTARENPMAQVHAKQYPDRYRDKGRSVHLWGIVINRQKHSIEEDFLTEVLTPARENPQACGPALA